MRLIGKILWTLFSWISGLIAGMVTFSVMECFLEDEFDGYTSRLFQNIFPKNE